LSPFFFPIPPAAFLIVSSSFCFFYSGPFSPLLTNLLSIFLFSTHSSAPFSFDSLSSIDLTFLFFFWSGTLSFYWRVSSPLDHHSSPPPFSLLLEPLLFLNSAYRDSPLFCRGLFFFLSYVPPHLGQPPPSSSEFDPHAMDLEDTSHHIHGICPLLSQRIHFDQFI